MAGTEDFPVSFSTASGKYIPVTAKSLTKAAALLGPYDDVQIKQEIKEDPEVQSRKRVAEPPVVPVVPTKQIKNEDEEKETVPENRKRAAESPVLPTKRRAVPFHEAKNPSERLTRRRSLPASYRTPFSDDSNSPNENDFQLSPWKLSPVFRQQLSRGSLKINQISVEGKVESVEEENALLMIEIISDEGQKFLARTPKRVFTPSVRAGDRLLFHKVRPVFKEGRLSEIFADAVTSSITFCPKEQINTKPTYNQTYYSIHDLHTIKGLDVKENTIKACIADFGSTVTYIGCANKVCRWKPDKKDQASKSTVCRNCRRKRQETFYFAPILTLYDFSGKMLATISDELMAKLVGADAKEVYLERAQQSFADRAHQFFNVPFLFRLKRTSPGYWMVLGRESVDFHDYGQFLQSKVTP
ncbi:unnamed protein product [Caenorhabditis auriculariae]|uniref:Uncharacterized protein n=1 Tax=Caenorhabditis auriculariae TaxID=2777116 RepID=A0A8S1HAV1_9PELO|nr:unnamed protein product [Caenorhabditis auriculariae]